jgi:hypothetical protein
MILTDIVNQKDTYSKHIVYFSFNEIKIFVFYNSIDMFQ